MGNPSQSQTCASTTPSGKPTARISLARGCSPHGGTQRVNRTDPSGTDPSVPKPRAKRDHSYHQIKGKSRVPGDSLWFPNTPARPRPCVKVNVPVPSVLPRVGDRGMQRWAHPGSLWAQCQWEPELFDHSPQCKYELINCLGAAPGKGPACSTGFAGSVIQFPAQLHQGYRGPQIHPPSHCHRWMDAPELC